MKRVLIWLGSIVALIVAAALGLLFLAPATVVSLTQWQAARAAGLESKTVDVNGYEVHYFEGGQGPILVMLHGMADDRHSFVGTAGALTDSYHVILPDLRGHGDNAPDPGLDYSIVGQRDFVRGFSRVLDLDHFFLAGNSMGGHVSAAFTLEYPEMVDRLILVNAAGLVVDDTVVYGGFGDTIETEEQFDALMARVMYNPPSVPGPIKRHLIATTNARVDFINGLAAAVREGPQYDLLDQIAAIQVPTLVLWGEEDVVVPMAVANAYAERIPSAELVLLPEAGHSPQLEAPDRVAKAIRDFLRAE
ncbi:alpha/beta fold hydrolase [Jannaschia pohangensis]|uniref:Pimeloyl-ACP methyl ester carboxylesterase n=1 Tax=Jannaschia pohangensis TaxID=390807 RepID=A0A1I3V3F0_9RHOB|nr:alpha/beta hydrolase [Jannaschia pohangensis]SFJ89473.1 Pimeloyl-ACP methyl ester carboxylesterase [Jannaschia pohangensis]